MNDDDLIQDKEYQEYLRLKKKYDKNKTEKDDAIDRDRYSGLYQGIHCLLNEHAEELLEEAIHLVQSGWYTPDIITHFARKYHLSEALCLYLNNEAITIVRMKSLSADEVVAVVQAYNEHVVKEALKRNS